MQERVRSELDRLVWGTRDATAARLLRAAGPPNRHVIGAITAGSLIDVARSRFPRRFES